MNFVVELTPKQSNTFLDYYQSDQVKSNTPTMKALIKVDGTTITHYHTNKVMFQGKHAEYWALFWENVFDIKILNKTKKSSPHTNDYYTPSIGSDESGVGDYFGPLTVCAVCLSQKDIAFVQSLDVKDSKKMTDSAVITIAPKLMKRLLYSSLVLPNEKYNTMIEKGYNAHKLKAYLHAQAHKHILSKTTDRLPIVIDQFCPESLYKDYLKSFDNPPIPDVFQTKAEDYYASVAAASIIARYRFLQELNTLSASLGIPLPKGASEKVDRVAAKLIKTQGESILLKVAKIHFKTTLKAKAHM